MKNNIIFFLLPFIGFFLGYRLIAWLHAPTIIVTPSLIGHTTAQAAIIASAQHLAVRVIQTITNEQLPEGTVLSQAPAPGQMIKSYQVISLTISAQPIPLIAPSYIGMDFNACNTHAQKHGITLQTYFLPSTQPAGICFAQLPAAGMPLTTMHDPASMIVYVSKPTISLMIVPDYRTQALPTLKEYITDTLFAFKFLHEHPVPAHHTCTNACVVIDQRPLPGSCITPTNNPTITLFIRTLTR